MSDEHPYPRLWARARNALDGIDAKHPIEVKPAEQVGVHGPRCSCESCMVLAIERLHGVPLPRVSRQ